MSCLDKMQNQTFKFLVVTSSDGFYANKIVKTQESFSNRARLQKGRRGQINDARSFRLILFGYHTCSTKIKCKHISEATLFSMTSGYTTDGDDNISILHVKKLSKVNFNRSFHRSADAANFRDDADLWAHKNKSQIEFRLT